MGTSRYSLGFTTLDDESSIATLPCRGAVPEWLMGTLIRNGPARFEVDGHTCNHWFDGLAMLHRFSFSGGRVGYTNRYLRGRAYCESMEAGEIRSVGFATNPDRTWLEKLLPFARREADDNCNINISEVAGDMIAMTESPSALRFDADTLATLGDQRWQDSVPGQITTAHPHFDYERACYYNYMLEFGRKSAYHIYRVAADSHRQERVATVPAKRPAYMHSFGMSRRYLILTEPPLVVNPLRLLIGSRPFIKNYKWQPERGTTFDIIDKNTGEVVKIAHSEPFFVFHHVNAFERDQEVVVDLVAYPDTAIIDHLYLDRLRSDKPVESTGRLMRFRVDLRRNGKVSSEPLSEATLEFPRINYYKRSTRPHRHVYGAGNQVSGDFTDNLVKVDIETGAFRAWYEDGCYPGEPVFVAAPDAQADDHGVILSLVLDSRSKTSFLLMLDAASFDELARAEVPHHIPFGFHGNFYPRGDAVIH